MAKLREIYVCSACASRSFQWKGQCPTCGEWNSLEPLQVRSGEGKNAPLAPRAERVMRLAEASELAGAVFSTGMAAFDRVLGKGLVPGSAVLVGGEPGIGKSTLLLQMAGAVAASGRRAVYLSGEESLSQIRSRAERLGLLHDNLYALATSQVEDIFPLIEG